MACKHTFQKNSTICKNYSFTCLHLLYGPIKSKWSYFASQNFKSRTALSEIFILANSVHIDNCSRL